MIVAKEREKGTEGSAAPLVIFQYLKKSKTQRRKKERMRNGTQRGKPKGPS